MALTSVAGCARHPAPDGAPKDAAGGDTAGSGVAGATNTPQTNVRELYTFNDIPVDVQLDGDMLYWRQEKTSSILRAPKDGSGPIETIGDWKPKDLVGKLLAFDHDYVYWRYGTALRRWSRADGTTTDLALGAEHDWHGGVESDAERIYLADFGCKAISFVDKASFMLEGFVTIPSGGQDLGGDTGIAVDATSVYCGHGKFVHRVAKDAAHLVEDLASDQDWVGPVTVGSGGVFWVNNRGNLGTHMENIAGIPTGTSTSMDLGTLGFGAASILYDEHFQQLYVIGEHRVVHQGINELDQRCALRTLALSGRSFLADLDASSYTHSWESCVSLVSDSDYFYATLEDAISTPRIFGAITRIPRVTAP